MNSTEDYPIGFFDSGIGGTSIWKEVHELLPNENTIYLADSKNAPYGQKSKEKIIEFILISVFIKYDIIKITKVIM